MTTVSRYLFAQVYSKIVGPRIHRDPELRREVNSIWSSVHGDVLEIGPGDGAHLRRVDPSIDKYVAVERNQFFAKSLREIAAEQGFAAEVVEGPAETELARMQNSSLDFVVISLVLCSVDNVPLVLAELRRVLKPGGTVRLIAGVLAC